MTDRPLGTPEPDATDPDVDALEAAEADAIDAAAPVDEEVELDDEVEPDDEDAEPDDGEPDDGGPDDYDAAVREVTGEDAVIPVASAGAGAGAIPTRRKPAPAPGHVPTASEKAVHVREDVSKVFVLAAVAVFAAILLNGLLLGRGGLLAPIPTASASASAAPSASASAGASPSASGSAGPSASPSVAASAAPSGSAAPAPSASPSP